MSAAAYEAARAAHAERVGEIAALEARLMEARRSEREAARHALALLPAAVDEQREIWAAARRVERPLREGEHEVLWSAPAAGRATHYREVVTVARERACWVVTVQHADASRGDPPRPPGHREVRRSAAAFGWPRSQLVERLAAAEEE